MALALPAGSDLGLLAATGRPHRRRAWLARAVRWVRRGNAYRPEEHYMRGGRTPGSRSMALARGAFRQA
jgi:hypothetical protein